MKQVKFQIIGIDRYVEDNPNFGKRFTIKNKEIYARILIRRKNNTRNNVLKKYS